jgi:hypothetical protein
MEFEAFLGLGALRLIYIFPLSALLLASWMRAATLLNQPVRQK